MSGHHVYTASSRCGAYAHCECGWSSEPYRSRLGASLAWARHFAAHVINGADAGEVEPW